MDRFCCDLPLRLLPGVISLILLIACGNTHQFADTSRERSAPVIPDSSPPVQSESDALPELPAEIPPTNPPETPSEPVVGVADPGGMVEARFPPGEPAEGSLLVRGSAAVATDQPRAGRQLNDSTKELNFSGFGVQLSQLRDRISCVFGATRTIAPNTTIIGKTSASTRETASPAASPNRAETPHMDDRMVSAVGTSAARKTAPCAH